MEGAVTSGHDAAARALAYHHHGTVHSLWRLGSHRMGLAAGDGPLPRAD